MNYVIRHGVLNTAIQYNTVLSETCYIQRNVSMSFRRTDDVIVRPSVLNQLQQHDGHLAMSTLGFNSLHPVVWTCPFPIVNEEALLKTWRRPGQAWAGLGRAWSGHGFTSCDVIRTFVFTTGTDRRWLLYPWYVIPARVVELPMEQSEFNLNAAGWLPTCQPLMYLALDRWSGAR